MRVRMLVQLSEASGRMGRVFGDHKGPVQKLLAENAKVEAKTREPGLRAAKEAMKEAKNLSQLNVQVQELYDAYLDLSRIVGDIQSHDVSLR